jgi:hypothetical protein
MTCINLELAKSTNKVSATRVNASLTLQRLKRAGELIQALEKIETELHSIFGFASGSARKAKPVAEEKSKKRVMSEAGRARIAAAQRARWAKQKGSADQKDGSTKTKTKKAKRTMSPEGRAKIAAAQKKRWAKQKAGK